MHHRIRSWVPAALAISLVATDALAANNSAFVSQTVPLEMTASTSYAVTVTYQNTGTTAWSQAAGHRLGSQNPQDGQTWGLGRVALSAGEVVPTGTVKALSFSVVAPAATGVYDFQWRMVQENVEWFGDVSPNVRVTVRPAAPSGLSPSGGVSLPSASSIAALSWGSAAGAASYAVRVKDLTDPEARDPRSNCPDAPAIFACINGVLGSALEIPVSPGHSYEWWIHSQGADGSWSPFSNALFSVSPLAPPPPVLISPTGPQTNGTQSVTLAWRESSGATRYAVRVQDETDDTLVHPGNNCTGSYVCVNDLTTLTLEVSVAAGHSYRWWVHAGNSAGYGAFSEASFSIPSGTCKPPLGLGRDDSAWMNQEFQGNPEGYELKLCPAQQYLLDGPVRIGKTDQALVTEGDGRALLTLRLGTTAVDARNVNGARLQNVQVDGGRGNSSRQSGDALLRFGGSAEGQSVIGVHAWDPPSWSLLHFYEGDQMDPRNPGSILRCSHGLIKDNHFSNIGRGFPTVDQWADGISLACRSTDVIDNEIDDATDGAIVIFGAPGSRILRNTIRAVNQTLLGGINMVDHRPYDGDYAGVLVSGNTIIASGAQIMAAIPMGDGAWSWCDHLGNSGGTVSGNSLQGPFMGFGYVISDVSGFSVLGNSSTATHSGRVHPDECGPSDSPAPFVAEPGDIGPSNSLQQEFLAGPVNKIIHRLSPPTPIALSPNGTTFPGTTTTVALSWVAARGTHSVVLRIRKDGAPWQELDLGADSSGYSLPVEPGHVYTWTVAACYGSNRFQEGTEQDPPATFTVLAAPTGVNSARIVSVSAPSTMLRGGSYVVSVTVENSGTTTWTRPMGYKLGSQNPQDNQTWGFGRVELGNAEAVLPGTQKTFEFVVTAPSGAGTYNFQWRMLREMVEWFGDPTTNRRVRVR